MIPAPPPLLNAREVKSRADFLAIASEYTPLRRAGRQFIGLCPLHSERHPSFYVHPEKQAFKCFGCGAGGDVFDFVMLAEGCNFLDALRIVAGFPGVASERGPRSGPRFRASVGASPSAAKRQTVYRQSAQESRAHVLAALDVADRRLRVIEATNSAALANLATACEPERGSPLFTCTQRISVNGRGRGEHR